MAKHGVKVSGVELDLDTMMNNKDQVVKGLTQGIEFLFKKNKVDWLGAARIEGAGKVMVEAEGGAERARRPRTS